MAPPPADVESVDGSRTRRPWTFLAIGILIAGALLRLIHMEADPVYPLWAGYVTDEGLWTEQARQLVLFGSFWPSSELAWLHFALSPLYQVVTVVPFALFGVTLASARSVSALSAIVLLTVAYLFHRRRFTSEGLIAVLVVLALQPDLLLLGRVAIPEMASILFSFLAFVALVSGRATGRRMFGAGVLTALALAFKATTAPLVPIFGVVAWVLRRSEAGGTPPLRRVAMYVTGTVAPALVVVPVVLFDGGSLAGQLAEVIRGLSTFLRVKGPYGAVAGLLYGEVAFSMSALLLPVWLVGGLLLGVTPLRRDTVRDIYVGSALWAVGWFAASSILEYFPERYVFHVLVPLALNLGAGLTILGRIGWGQVLSGLRELEGRRRTAVAAWLSFPVALVLLPIVVHAATSSGLALERLRHHAVIVALGVSILTLAMKRWWRAPGLLTGLVAFPLVALALRRVLVVTELMEPMLWEAGGSRGLELWLLAMALAAGCLTLVGEGRSRRIPVASAYLYATVLCVFWLWTSAAKLARPTYTVREAGAAVEAMVAEGETVGVPNTRGVMLGTTIPYATVEEPLPDLVVVVFDHLHPTLVERYRLERRFEINLGEGYLSRVDVDPIVEVYRRIDEEPPG